MIIDKFGIAAIRNSWCDANKITDFTINGYTKVRLTQMAGRLMQPFNLTFFLSFKLDYSMSHF